MNPEMFENAENRLGFSMSFFKRKPFLLLLATLISCLAFSAFSSILGTIPVLVLSTIVFLVKFSNNKKKNTFLDENHKDQPEEEVTKQQFECDSVDLSSDTDSSEGSELDWVIPGDPCQNGSISDEEEEEGLIEIALMGGDSVEPKKTQMKCVQNLSVDSVLKEDKVMEVLGEEIIDVNEEDNLIEIDISMGSIKRSML